MGQKVHPRGVRLGVIDTWDSTWYANAKGGEYGKCVKEDHDIRTFVKKELKHAAVSRIEIDRKSQRLIIRIVTGRPGIIVGRGGQGLDMLRKKLIKLTGRQDIQLDVLEVARVEADAQLVAESIAQQLEKRIAFRRAMKQSIQRSMHAGIKGIKIMVSGRLGGVEIARTEWAKEGRIPLHTFRADIHYGFTEAKTMFGIIGVKVWIFKGEVLPGETALSNVKLRGQGNANEGGGEGGLQGAGGRGRGRRGPGQGGPGGPGGPGGGRGRRKTAPVTVVQAANTENAPAESPAPSAADSQNAAPATPPAPSESDNNPSKES
ncbi:MAG: 30S ribosomal protein S3 [Vampirovibrio sp.]|nr:30S ribosomal protein S3 [Vampirovibrio sp.]